MPLSNKIFAHRGLSSVLPENTLPAIEKALESDIQGVEFDIELSKDGVPFLVHQENFVPNDDLNQLLLVAPQKRRAWVSQYFAESLGKMDAGRWFSENFAGLSLCTLQAALSLDWNSKIALMEIKDELYWDSKSPHPSQREIIDALKKPLSQFIETGCKAQILSFSPNILGICREVFPNVELIQLVSSYNFFQDLLAVSTDHLSAFAVSEKMALKHPEIFPAVKSKGKEIYVYERTNYREISGKIDDINERKQLWSKLIDSGVNGIITNYAGFGRAG